MTEPDDLTLAHRLADAADAVSLNGFGGRFTVTTKADDTPVTEIDRAAEMAVRDLIAAHHPTDAVHGEEHADTGESRRRWIIDPIDGTKNFIRGVPVWASLISLSVDDRVEVAVVSAPALSRRWWARRGHGARMRWTDMRGTHEKDLRVSAVTDLAHASVSYSSIPGWSQLAKRDVFLDLHEQTWRQRGFGDFWSYMLVAEGAVDIAAEPEVPLYDLAAVSLIVEEAGGAFTNVFGVPGPDGGSALASNGTLHAAALTVLARTS